MNIFTSLFGALDEVLDIYVNEAVVAATGYVAGPLLTLGVIVFITFGILMLRGVTEFPAYKFIQTAGLIVIVFLIAGVAGNYNVYLATHLRQLPNELLGAFAGTGLEDDAAIGAVFDRIGDRALTGISAIWSAGSFTDPGPSLFAAILFVIFLIFGVAVVIALATAKIGISLVVGVGPIMIVGLLFQATREYFTRWLSYGVQFSFLTLFVGGIAGITNEIVDVYIDVFDETAENVDLVALMAPALMLLLLAKIFADLPNMAASISGGIGLSIGNTAWQGVQGVMNQAGGKHIAALRDAARFRRVERAQGLHESIAEMRKKAVSRIVNRSNKVTGRVAGTAEAGAEGVSNPSSQNLVYEAREHVRAKNSGRNL